MIQPGQLPLSRGRYVPFSFEIDVQGLDLTGATLMAQVRLTSDAPGDPTAIFAITSPAVATTAGLTTSSIALSLTQAQMEAMPAAAEVGSPLALAWDLIVAPSSGNRYVLLAGSFTIQPGVTR